MQKRLELLAPNQLKLLLLLDKIKSLGEPVSASPDEPVSAGPDDVLQRCDMPKQLLKGGAYLFIQVYISIFVFSNSFFQKHNLHLFYLMFLRISGIQR